MTDQYLNVAKIGGNICVRGIDADGFRYKEKIPYEPYAYLETNEESKFQSMHGKNLKRKDFESPSEYFQFKNSCKGQGIKVYGMDNHVCSYMTDNFDNDFDPKCQRIFFLDIENKLKGDDGINHGIDTEGAYGELTAITVYDTLTETYHVFGQTVWENIEYPDHKIKYYHCDDEFHLIREFVKFWSSDYPDIVTGWNSTGYDIPYLINRIEKICGKAIKNKLSPWGKITSREFRGAWGKTAVNYSIIGISSLDYTEVYKKNTFHKQESYKLDFIANDELGKGKVDYKAEGYRNLDDLYERNPQKYIDYNIRDVESLIQIDDKNKFMEIVVGIAHYSIVNYDEVYSVLRCWDSIRHRYLKNIGVITSPRSQNIKTDKFTGAYVKVPRPNMYRWVITFDLASLYPSIIQTCNIGDETLVPPHLVPAELMNLYDRDITNTILNGEITQEQKDCLVANHLTMAANGTFYSNVENSVQSILSADILAKRGVYKQDMLKYKDELVHAKADGASKAEIKRLSDLVTMNTNNQKVVKELANSLYGAMGNEHDRYFDLLLAEGVTLTGQIIIKWAEIKLNAYLNTVLKTKGIGYIFYSDTDSIFVNLEPMVKALGLDESDTAGVVEFMDATGEKLNDKLSEFFDELSSILNSTNSKIAMKREIISSSTLFRSKKNYAMKVWDDEGVRLIEPDYKIMGIETQKSTTPAFVKKHIKHIIKRLLSDCSRGEILNYVSKFENEYMAEKNFENIFFPKGTSDIDKWLDDKTFVKKRCPGHVRGSHVFNKFYSTADNKIEGGDSVRYSYLLMPNPTGQYIISVIDEFPEELWKYVDHQTNFEKIFKSPVETLTKLMGWSMHNTVNMADLI